MFERFTDRHFAAREILRERVRAPDHFHLLCDDFSLFGRRLVAGFVSNDQFAVFARLALAEVCFALHWLRDAR